MLLGDITFLVPAGTDFALVTLGKRCPSLLPSPTPPRSLRALFPFEEGSSQPLRKRHQNKTSPVLLVIPFIRVVNGDRSQL